MKNDPISREDLDKFLHAALVKENPELTNEDSAGPGDSVQAQTGGTEAGDSLERAPAGLASGMATFETTVSPHVLETWAPLSDLQVQLTAEIGTTSVTVGDIMQLGIGSRLPLKTRWMEPLALKLNGKRVGYGRVVLVGNKFGVQVTTWGCLPR